MGYIHRGRFNLLFSAGYPLGERELGVDVPHTFRQLDVGPILDAEPRPPGCLSAGAVREVLTRARASMYPYVRSIASVPPTTTSDARSSLLEPGSGISFQLSGDQGAALLTKHPTYSQDIQRRGTFEEYIKEHYDSWVVFARECGHGNDVKPILVTGVDMTRSFAMMSYSNDGDDLTADFTVSNPGAAPPWGTWRTPGTVYTNCGPQPRRLPTVTQTMVSGPSGSSHPETDSDEYRQCVFVRYYTVRKRMGIPRVIKAGAGPHDLGPGNRDDRGSPLETQCKSDSGSDTLPSPFGNDGDGDDSSATTIDSEPDIIIHNTAAVGSLQFLSTLTHLIDPPQDERDDFDTVADYVFKESLQLECQTRRL